MSGHDASASGGSGGLVVAPASAAEWALVEQWAADENWNPGLRDVACFHPTDPGGFFVGRLDGRPVSAVSVVRYSEAYAFLGYYLVRPDLRGRGLGRATWRAALPHAGRRTVGLDAVPEQEPAYRRSGFAAAYRSVRYGGRPAPVRPPGERIAAGVERAAPDGLDAVAAYDAPCFPAGRRAFLARWLAEPGHVAYVRMRGGTIRGYGVIRPARSGHRVGPLFADTPEDAGALLDALLSHADPAGSVAVDVPEGHASARAVVEERGLAAQWHTVRMYAGPAPRIASARIFGSTSLELG
ncbi:GNAT family N-acetyltransferase [Streptomyces fuscigenes]|uniref:GNAT family N-acetyltransferase n=1 Tax=Streptomyces fuscigenes TaxID=1528880 RepID=UPI001F1B8D7F|nr:GNAT family N-acetyltransferase [Streptomyces fuscigenes]MCF3960560.1 GNAT family N-acetyltransferase [Streptomyces fuscigenes]